MQATFVGLAGAVKVQRKRLRAASAVDDIPATANTGQSGHCDIVALYVERSLMVNGQEVVGHIGSRSGRSNIDLPLVHCDTPTDAHIARRGTCESDRSGS